MQSAPQPKIKPESICESEDPDSIVSLGYNIATDDSCNLDQPTDLPNTDPLLSGPDEDGIRAPLPGSPAIDSGPVDVIVFEGDTLATLPCGYRDLKGTARPQDANGDGVFECDRGAVEVAGAGDIVAGHSGAFFNPLRDGEGTYVEILNDDTAVVYTFTYRPDGSGPAWFIGVGKISGNSIIIDELLRPLGTRFGDGFDKDNIDFTPIGGMSMVFPDCKAGANPGNIAYSGEPGLAYEGLITKATRLSNITGCGAETPSAKAGLSGSYFEPARDGEGIIVEWLTSGDVLVVFFTYDQNGNQLWLLGIGTPNGNTVTMDALYASAYTPWGRNFNAADVSIDTWGTFTLTWTACNSVTFEYASNRQWLWQRDAQLHAPVQPAGYELPGVPGVRRFGANELPTCAKKRSRGNVFALFSTHEQAGIHITHPKPPNRSGWGSAWTINWRSRGCWILNNSDGVGLQGLRPAEIGHPTHIGRVYLNG